MDDEDELESYNDNDGELERQGRWLSSRARKQTDYQGDCQYQSAEFYKAEKQLIDKYEEVSGGIKADISPDPLPLPQEMSKQKNNLRDGLLAIIHHPCKVGNLTQTKMDMQLHSLLAYMKMRLIMVSLQTSNSFLGKCLSTLQTVPWVKFPF